MGFVTLPVEIREIRATEKVLRRIYDAALLGLSDDSLALAAGLRPHEFKQLRANDPMIDEYVLKAKADSEAMHARMLHVASQNGDAKASLAILQHKHGWAAKQQVEVSNTTTINIRALLDERDARVRGMTYEHNRGAAIDTARNDEPGVLPVAAKVCDVGVPVGGGRSS